MNHVTQQRIAEIRKHLSRVEYGRNQLLLNQSVPWLLQLVEEQQREIEGYKQAEESLIEDAGKATQYNWLAAEYRDKVDSLQAENQRYREAFETIIANCDNPIAVYYANEALAERSSNE